jgi:hypothetical protein
VGEPFNGARIPQTEPVVNTPKNGNSEGTDSNVRFSRVTNDKGLPNDAGRGRITAEGDEVAKRTSGKIEGYTERQLENWQTSKSIIIYENDNQLRNFIDNAIAKRNLGDKMYCGKITDTLAAQITNETGVDVNGYNLSLSAYEIEKILKDHGIELKEVQRGQRAIAEEDFFKIPEIVASYDKVELDGTYNGRPVLKFEKTINGKTTVITYQSSKSHDLIVQTMYSGQDKGSLSPPISEQALINTP